MSRMKNREYFFHPFRQLRFKLSTRKAGQTAIYLLFLISLLLHFCSKLMTGTRIGNVDINPKNLIYACFHIMTRTLNEYMYKIIILRAYKSHLLKYVDKIDRDLI